MESLPKISIVTPSLNQADFIEATIQSVLNQGYPYLEFWVMDGGSSDGTIDILKKYNGRLFWKSEPDNGQANAINKGLKLVTGDVVAFLNSDDLYEPGTLLMVGKFFASHPKSVWLTGQCININKTGKVIRPRTRLYKNFWLSLNNYSILQVLNFISQPATFWRRNVMEEVGYLDEELHYTMDYEYWLRLGKKYHLDVIHRNLSRFRIHSSSKSGTTIHRQFDEEFAVAQRYCSRLTFLLHKVYRQFIIEVYRRTN